MNLVKNISNIVCRNVLPVKSNYSLSVFENVQQVRGTRRHVRPVRIRYPAWFLQRDRAKTLENITKENKSFIQEVLHDKFGSPAIIGGVPTYERASPLKVEPTPQGEWNKGTRRVGLICRKLGQYPMWDKDGNRFMTTLLQVADNHVVKYIPPGEFEPTLKPYKIKRRRMGCVLVGAESADPQKFTKEYCGLFSQAGVMPKKTLCRFIVSPEAEIQPGTPLFASHFQAGDFVDCRAVTIDRGFQGVMKRWGFKGMRATHGVTKTHRRPGNIGGGGEKARVWPGKKLPGHMGNIWRVNKGAKILRINTKYNVLYVKGIAIPGRTGCIVYVYDTMLPLRKRKEAPPFPTFYPDKVEEPLADDIYAEGMHPFSSPTIMFEPEKVVKKKKK